MSIKPTFAGEMQFVTFTDSSRGGPRITLRLSDRDELEVFVGKEGKRFQAVLVEIGDDELPVVDRAVADTPAVDHEPAKVIQKGGERAKLCGIWCNTPDFQDWLRRNHPFAWRTNAKGKAAREDAASALRAVLAIESRSEIDNNQVAADRFETLIRRPYMAHMESRGVAA